MQPTILSRICLHPATLVPLPAHFAASLADYYGSRYGSALALSARVAAGLAEQMYGQFGGDGENYWRGCWQSVSGLPEPVAAAGCLQEVSAVGWQFLLCVYCTVDTWCLYATVQCITACSKWNAGDRVFANMLPGICDACISGSSSMCSSMRYQPDVHDVPVSSWCCGALAAHNCQWRHHLVVSKMASCQPVRQQLVTRLSVVSLAADGFNSCGGCAQGHIPLLLDLLVHRCAACCSSLYPSVQQ